MKQARIGVIATAVAGGGDDGVRAEDRLLGNLDAGSGGGRSRRARPAALRLAAAAAVAAAAA